MTLAEFLTWENQQPQRHEFYRGETYGMAGGTARHNRLILNLASRVGAHLDGTQCQVFATSMKVQIPEGVMYPDLMAICGTADAGDEQIMPNPMLIIEVLCPSTKGYDKHGKFTLYRTLASLREYVLIDPVTGQIEVYTRSGGAEWSLTDQTQAAVLTLSSIDCMLPLELVYKGVEVQVV